jgi:PEP-utilising enzyme, mobile domain
LQAVSPPAGGSTAAGGEGGISSVTPPPALRATSPFGGGKRAWVGDDLINLLGVDTLDEIADALSRAHTAIGANRAEWALDGQIWILQLARDPLRTPVPLPRPEWTDPRLVPVARAVIKAGGRLGDELILPWALGGLPEPGPPIEGVPVDAMASALELRDELTAEVWGLPAPAALAEARSCMRMLLGTDPRSAVNVISSLDSPDPTTAASLLALVEAMERNDPSPRRGVGRWEPFVAAVVLSAGTTQEGTPASAGFGAGIVHRGQTAFRPRSVISAPEPVPNLAPLLWDAAAIVTETGSPAAHLFESARALRVPAVCGVAIPSGEQIVAVDGHNGVVATIPLQDLPDA